MKRFNLLKKLAIVLLMFNAVPALSQKKVFIFPKVSYDITGNHSVNVLGERGSLGVNSALSLSAEFLRPIGDNVKAGIGMMYLLPREQVISGSGNFTFAPIYISTIIPMSKDSVSNIPSLILNIGYNLVYSGDANYTGGSILQGGIYIGGGFRLVYKKIFMDGLYKSFSGKADLGENVNENLRYLDITYSTFSIGIGVTL